MQLANLPSDILGQHGMPDRFIDADGQVAPALPDIFLLAYSLAFQLEKIYPV